MLSVAIIGGIGSGKSFICSIFESMGISVFYADIAMKKMYEDPSIKPQVCKLIGNDVYRNNKFLPKEASKILFSNKPLLCQFNLTLYPYLVERFEKWKTKQYGSFVILESAVLIESPVKFSIDKIIAVEAPENLRIARVKQRDDLTENSIRERISLQMSDMDRRRYADFVIDNSEKSSLLEQIHLFCSQKL